MYKLIADGVVASEQIVSVIDAVHEANLYALGAARGGGIVAVRTRPTPSKGFEIHYFIAASNEPLIVRVEHV